MRSLRLMEGVDLSTRPIGRVWLRGLHAKHLYLGISGVYGDKRDISIHGPAPFYQFSSISLFNLRLLTLTIATPVYGRTGNFELIRESRINLVATPRAERSSQCLVGGQSQEEAIHLHNNGARKGHQLCPKDIKR
ncbi:hypothetical protein PIB30_082187, partial [Stylosanthes scabra]|nr:hypothetical protein [Stylosanthes scabra]